MPTGSEGTIPVVRTATGKSSLDNNLSDFKGRRIPVAFASLGSLDDLDRALQKIVGRG